MHSLNDIQLLAKGKGWVYQRKDGLILIQLVDESKNYSRGRTISTRTTDLDEAYYTIKAWLSTSFPEKVNSEGREPFWKFCERYWSENLNNSNTTQLHRKENAEKARQHIHSYFKETQLRTVTPELVRGFFDYLRIQETSAYRKAKLTGLPYSKNRFLSVATIKQYRNAICMPLQYAQTYKLNTRSPDWLASCRLKGTSNNSDNYFANMVLPRDIFSQEELEKLDAYHWEDKRMNLLYKIARYTGMRYGELRGLKIGAVQEDRILIKAAYNDVDHDKTTKTRQVRMYPISAKLYELIRDYVMFLPLNGPEDYLFPGNKPGCPVGPTFGLKNLDRAMVALEIPKTREYMGVTYTRTFHSIRHCKDMELMKANFSVNQISTLVGHHAAMVARYTNHFNEDIFNSLKDQLDSAGLL